MLWWRPTDPKVVYKIQIYSFKCLDESQTVILAMQIYWTYLNAKIQTHSVLSLIQVNLTNLDVMVKNLQYYMGLQYCPANLKVKAETLHFMHGNISKSRDCLWADYRWQYGGKTPIEQEICRLGWWFCVKKRVKKKISSCRSNLYSSRARNISREDKTQTTEKDRKVITWNTTYN